MIGMGERDGHVRGLVGDSSSGGCMWCVCSGVSRSLGGGFTGVAALGVKIVSGAAYFAKIRL